MPPHTRMREELNLDAAERTREERRSFFCSWSGGKDAALALSRALASGQHPAGLLTMMTEAQDRSRSHGIHRHVLLAQSRAIGVPLRTVATTWDHYTRSFRQALTRYREAGVTRGVFGDLDFEANRHWVRQVCAEAGMEAVQPLWGEPRRALLQEFFDLGFTAAIVAVDARLLPRSILGQVLSEELVSWFEGRGIDPSGERGEYHTLVLDGPYFTRQLHVEPGTQVLRDGYWFQDFRLVSSTLNP